MAFYESLGVSKRINAAAYYTALGGSIMSADVIAAMNDASKSFISMHDLQLKAGKKIAKLTKNEGAYITTGAGAAIALSILAFRTKGDINEIQRIVDGGSVTPNHFLNEAEYASKSTPLIASFRTWFTKLSHT